MTRSLAAVAVFACACATTPPPREKPRLPPEFTNAAALGAFARCYETEIATVPRAEGKLSVNVVLDSEGSVRGAHVTLVDGALSKEMQDCISLVIRLIHFSPGPNSGGEVEFPFVFNHSD